MPIPGHGPEQWLEVIVPPAPSHCIRLGQYRRLLRLTGPHSRSTFHSVECPVLLMLDTGHALGLRTRPGLAPSSPAYPGLSSYSAPLRPALTPGMIQHPCTGLDTVGDRIPTRTPPPRGTKCRRSRYSPASPRRRGSAPFLNISPAQDTSACRRWSSTRNCPAGGGRRLL